ncbi:MAG: hypothetical protein ACREID_07335 [Planctomycetota bacterium]
MAKPRGRRWLSPRRGLVAGVVALSLWASLSHFVARRIAMGWLEEHYVGRASVSLVVLWPWLAIDGYGVRLVADGGEHRHRLEAPRVSVRLDPWSLFAGRAVRSIHVSGLRGEVEEGSSLALFSRPRGGEAEAPASDDMEPSRMPPLSFTGPEVRVGPAGGTGGPLLAAARADVEQTGDRTYRFLAERGVLARVPFDKISCRLVPGGGRFAVAGWKMYAFDGLVDGYIEVDGTRAGAVNGELSWRGVDLRRVAAVYRLPAADEMEGELEGTLLFEGERCTRDALKGKGTLRLRDARFVSPVSLRVVLLLKLPVPRPSIFHAGHMVFSFEGAHFYIERAHGVGTSFDLEAQGIVTFDGRADLEVTHGSTTVAVRGTLNDPSATLLPMNYVTRPFDRIFRERIASR